MTDTTEDTPLQGVEFETPKALVFDEFLKLSLRDALVSYERMTLPDMTAADECKTHAESEALHAPYFRDMYAFLWNSTMAHFLIRMQENVPRVAEAIAAEVKEWLDAGDAYNEWIWQWADERGMKPDELVADARAKREEWLAEPTKSWRQRQGEVEFTIPAE